MLGRVGALYVSTRPLELEGVSVITLELGTRRDPGSERERGLYTREPCSLLGGLVGDPAAQLQNLSVCLSRQIHPSSQPHLQRAVGEASMGPWPAQPGTYSHG